MIQRRGFLAGLLVAGMAPGIVRASSLMKSRIIQPPQYGLVIRDINGNVVLSAYSGFWGRTEYGHELTVQKLDALGIDPNLMSATFHYHSKVVSSIDLSQITA
jgi:hypothetical protein